MFFCEGKTMEFSGSLGLIIGDIYVIPANIWLEKGLVKNMWVKLVDIVLQPDVSPVWNPTDNFHSIEAIQIKHVIVQLLFGIQSTTVLFPGFEPGHVPIRPSRCTSSVKFPNLVNPFSEFCLQFQLFNLDSSC